MTLNSAVRPKPAPPREPNMMSQPGPSMTGPALPPLTGVDRCESCNQPAQSAWLMRRGNEHPLLFCGHHTRRFLVKLEAQTPFASLVNPGIATL